MKFTHYNLGHLSGGETVEIQLSGNAANVRLIWMATMGIMPLKGDRPQGGTEIRYRLAQENAP